jgi:arylsulfatase A-like enzyme
MLESRQGDPEVAEREQLTLEMRRDCDRDYLTRAEAFITRCALDQTPFFLYFNHSLMHMPVIPREEFKGRSGQGDWADSLLELDADFGTLLDLLDRVEIAQDTLVIFAGDNGPKTYCCGEDHPAIGKGPTSPVARGTSAHRASSVGPATSRRDARATRSCTSPTGSPRSCTAPVCASPATASSTASTSSAG